MSRTMMLYIIIPFSLVFSGCSSAENDCHESIANPSAVSSEPPITQNSELTQNGYLTISSKESDLGYVYEYDIAQGQVELKNDTVELITITDINSSCGCGVVKLPQREILPGRTLVLHYTINTAGKNGIFSSHFNVFFDVGRMAVNQNITFRSTVNVITKGKVIANPAFIKKDDAVFLSRFNEKIVLYSLNKETLPDVIDIQHPEWLKVGCIREEIDRMTLEIESQIPNMSGQLDGKIVLTLDSERYSHLEIPLFFQIKGLISFENSPVVRIVKESDIPVDIDILARLTKAGQIESFSLDSEDITEKSVDFEFIDDLLAVFKVTFLAIGKNAKSQTVFRSTLIVQANIGEHQHVARLPIILIVPR